MKRIITALAVVFFTFTFIGFRLGPMVTQAAPAPQEQEPEKPPLPTSVPDGTVVESLNRPTEPDTPVDTALREAFARTAEIRKNQLMAFMIYQPVVDSIHYAADGKSALLWIGLRDPLTGDVVETEPGLAIAHIPQEGNSALPASWEVTLQSEPAFDDQLQSLPEELQSEEIQQRFVEEPEAVLNLAGPYQGYRLPWTAGTSRRVTGSIGHFLIYNSCSITSCRYAYDFADGTMFPLLASKGGTVKALRTSCPNFNEDCTNYLVLEDQSTVPTTFQLYYHMAYNSVPEKLRVVGAQVRRGEYIGDVDDTGYSSGHHLHFHVYEKPSNTSTWSWGNSVDFQYEDVPINSGHLRTCYEATNWPSYGTECNAGADGKRGTGDDNWFVSGNTPANPPSGTLSMPADRQWVDRPTLYVGGTAYDDIQISRIQALVNYDGTWRSIGDLPMLANGSYGQEVDLCAANVPNGPFALTVKIFDREGSPAPNIPVRQLVKNYNCASSAPPAAAMCSPAPNEVALYTLADYRGSCQKYAYREQGFTAAELGGIADNTATSIEVGSGVRAVLFDRSADATSGQPGGRSETLESSDANLSDNRIGSDTLSGLRLLPRTAPNEPILRAPGNQYNGNASTLDSLVLAWEGGEGATQFDVTLQGPSANWTRSTTESSLSIGSLEAGTYTYTVTARNSQGSNQTSTTFSVAAGSFPSAAALSVPYGDTLESDATGWISSGLWRYGSVTAGTRAASKAYVSNDGVDYASETWKAGDLTSPPITLPGSAVSYLRFLYFAATEDGEVHWDQRRVQISVFDGVRFGPFTDLVQLFDDKQLAQAWFSSGPISLNGYQGKTVRIRFHFDAVDEDRNTGFGWAIDDITINTTAPNTSCSDGGVVPTLTFGQAVSASICPEGDEDFYYINAAKGQQVTIDIDARASSPSSALDSYIYLLDSNGRSILAENDDEEYLKKVDSLLTYTFSRSGTFLVKVKAWNHPGVGSTAHFYKITARVSDSAIPPASVGISYPSAPNMIPGTSHWLRPTAVDYDGGAVAQVDLYWHGPDWSNPSWVKVGSDSVAADGWHILVTPSNYGGVAGSALYLQARSKAGGTTGMVWWNLQPDTTIPSSTITPLPNVSNSTAVQVTWSASDPMNDIIRFELQYQRNGGAWQNWTERTLTGSDRGIWFLGEPGTYGFRMRAFDSSGNMETYTTGPEAQVTISSVCAPDGAESESNAASSLAPGVYSADYNLCVPPGGPDVDWVSMQAQGGEKYTFSVVPEDSAAGFTVTLYNASLQKIGSWSSGDFGRPAGGTWQAAGSGMSTYYVEIKPVRTNLWGTDVRYQVTYSTAQSIYIPFIRR